MKTGFIARPVALFAAGILVATAFAARSEIAAMINPATQAPPGCDELRQSMAAVVNDKVKLIAMTSIDPGKYFDAGSPDSCLGNLSTANVDLSQLIPDPLGMLTGGVDSMIDGLKKAALGAACTAARRSVGDTIDRYNAALSSINGGLVQSGIDSTIGTTAHQVLDAAAMTWQTPTAANVLSGVSPAPARALPAVPHVQQVTPQTLPAQPQPEPLPVPNSLGAAIFR